MDPSTVTITPPQAASVNPFPISRRRSEYAEQGQHAYSGSISLAKPIDYPQLSAQHVLPPPPRAATPSSTRSPVKQAPPFPSLQQAYQLPNQNLRMIRSDYPINYWRDEQIGISGLRNLGNTCYMNSTLQCLSAAVPFTRFFTGARPQLSAWFTKLTSPGCRWPLETSSQYLESSWFQG
jgi:ubiquitin carboxyl-terminal hydrolase 8